jgi:lysozyme
MPFSSASRKAASRPVRAPSPFSSPSAIAGAPESAATARALYHGADGFTAARYNALVSMAFNLGRGGMRRFTNMSAAIACNDWELAADEALNSVWARQVPARAHEIARALRGS